MFSNTELKNHFILHVGLTLGSSPTDRPSHNFEVFPTNFDQVASMSYEYEIGAPVDEIIKKAPANSLSLLKNALIQANGIVQSFKQNSMYSETSEVSTLDSVWSKLPGFQGVSPLAFESQIEFKFNFGLFGKYSGKKEVYEPIMELAQLFAPKLDDADGSTKGLINTGGLLPISGQVVAQATSQVLKELSQIGKNPDNEGAGKDSSLIDLAFQKAKAVTTGYNKAVEKAYPKANTLFCRLVSASGTYVSPLFVVKGVSYSLDYSNIDSQNYPMSGSFVLKGCQTFKLATREMAQECFCFTSVSKKTLGKLFEATMEANTPTLG